MNLAICSPNKNAYSETFIQQHKQQLRGNIFYYYGGEIPSRLEGAIVINSRRRRIIDIFKGYLHLNRFSLAEQALMKSFQKKRIEKVLAEYASTAARILPVCKELALPLVVHFHGFDAFRKDILRVYNNYREVFSYASYIVVVSQEMYSQLISLGCPEKKLVLNIYGPRTIFLDIRPSYKKPWFAASGRFVDKKAPYYLILAFQKVVKKYPEAKLTIAGTGPLWNTCKNLIRHFKLEKNIKLPGILKTDEIMDLLKNSMGFLQHSIIAEDGDMEGTPLSILEASAAGLPVIATRHAGIPEVIKDRHTGILIEEHDVEAMAAVVLELLDKPELAEQMGKSGKEFMQNNYRIEDHIAVLNKLIKNA